MHKSNVKLHLYASLHFQFLRSLKTVWLSILWGQYFKAAITDRTARFLSILSKSVYQRLYLYSAYVQWCFSSRCSNSFVSTVQHIAGVRKSCRFYSSTPVTAFQVGCAPHPLCITPLFLFFLVLFTHFPPAPLFSSFMPKCLSSSRLMHRPPTSRRPVRALNILRLGPISRAALWVMGARIPPHLSCWWNLSAWERQSWSPLSKVASFFSLRLEVLLTGNVRSVKWAWMS